MNLSSKLETMSIRMVVSRAQYKDDEGVSDDEKTQIDLDIAILTEFVNKRANNRGLPKIVAEYL